MGDAINEMRIKKKNILFISLFFNRDIYILQALFKLRGKGRAHTCVHI